jgi:hypothetical protein
LAAEIAGHGGFVSWMTRKERAAQAGGSRTLKHGFGNDDGGAVTLDPPYISRGALRNKQAEVAQDLTVLLRRKFQ